LLSTLVCRHDLVPDPTILTAALHATRRVNDFPTSVRIFEGIKDKSPDEETYQYVVQQVGTLLLSSYHLLSR
jgi:cytochrome c oxidase subunit 5a